MHFVVLFLDNDFFLNVKKGVIHFSHFHWNGNKIRNRKKIQTDAPAGNRALIKSRALIIDNGHFIARFPLFNQNNFLLKLFNLKTPNLANIFLPQNAADDNAAVDCKFPGDWSRKSSNDSNLARNDMRFSSNIVPSTSLKKKKFSFHKLIFKLEKRKYVLSSLWLEEFF